MRLNRWISLVALAAACGTPGTNPSAPPANPPAATAIDLELHDVSMQDALVALGQKARVNFSLDPDIEDSVTISVHQQPWDQVLDAIVKDHGLAIEHLKFPKGEVLRISRATTAAPPEQTFAGAPIDVSFDGVPIRTAVKTIAELAKVEIVVDEGVEATVTQFAKQVPWDFVLDHVVRKYSLRIVRSGSTIHIAKL